jgi:hypothetical protein
LFLSLWRALEEEIPPQRPLLDDEILSALQILRVHYVPIHFVYALIHDRLRHRFDPHCFSTRWEELQKLMLSTDIRLAPDTLESFRLSLLESGIHHPDKDRLNININLLLSASQYLSGIYEEECRDSLRQQTIAKNSSHSVPSASVRYIQALQPQWEKIKRQLLLSRHGDLSLQEFTHSVLREGGVVMAPRDILELWRHIAGTGNIDLSFESEREVRLPLSLFDQVMRNPEANYSSLAAVMREPTARPSSLRLVDPSPNKEDNVSSLLMPQEQSRSKNTFYRTAAAPFPWQLNEAALTSNVRRRVIDGLRRTGCSC